MLCQFGDEFAVIQNAGEAFPPTTLYPLAYRDTEKKEQLIAAITGLGTITSSDEALRAQSLEFMLRTISGKTEKSQWRGLDEIIDYPNIMGCSRMHQIEYLIKRYKNFIEEEAVKKSLISSLVHILLLEPDQGKRLGLEDEIRNLGLNAMLSDEKLSQIYGKEVGLNPEEADRYFYEKYQGSLKNLDFQGLLRAGAVIYYEKYHEALRKTPRFEPMPGAAEMLALSKGWLGDDIIPLIMDSKQGWPGEPGSGTQKKEGRLTDCANYFVAHPIRLALLSSATQQETDLILQGVFKAISLKIASWNIPDKKKAFLLERFSNYNNIYEVVVSAPSFNEMRLKPHPDLCSAALYRLGIDRLNLSKVIGLESSESGVIALRASGIGLSVAVPFKQTGLQDFRAASVLCKGGLQELILRHNLFLKA